MADEAHNAPASAWNTQYENYLSLTLKLEQAPPQDRDVLEREIAEICDGLLDTPAPHAIALLRKLELLFEGDLHGLDRASEERRLIIEDLEGLIQAQHQLLGTV